MLKPDAEKALRVVIIGCLLLVVLFVWSADVTIPSTIADSIEDAVKRQATSEIVSLIATSLRKMTWVVTALIAIAVALLLVSKK